MCIAYIQSMNGQYLCNRQITVSYAYKKDTKGERHGTPAVRLFLLLIIFFFFVIYAERVLAASNPGTQRIRPHTLFASGPPTLPNGPQANGSVPPAIPPRPFANGPIPPAPLPVVRPPSLPVGQFPPPMQWPAQSQHGQGLPQPGMPPPPHQQFRPPANLPPPPPTGMMRPPPPPSGVGVPPPALWRPPPPPQQMAGRPMPPPPMPMPPNMMPNGLAP
ncbi:hypothetical protein B296_00017814 [Ensete ventricosum]|uniref:RRM domain-containing protein n=1 Tax=Ensete ventricosum TaxID=4639 RepID=A0A426ZA75_ENSVE|nr:hypothetical protein B296_00017814 [Ensete ventricosum]